MSIDQSTFNGNSARDGGAIANPLGQLRMHNCTVSTNVAERNGGGLSAQSYAEIFSITIAFNRARTGQGGGVYMQFPNSRTNACIIAKNTHGTGTQVADDYFGNPHGQTTSDSRSLFGTTTGTSNLLPTDLTGDPLLGALAANGGQTRTHAIGTNSPAYNRELSNPNAESIDQRGVARPRAATRDLGAFEF